MAVVFQVVLFLVDWASKHFGSQGILTSSALLGLTDVDALTFSMAKIANPDNINVTAQALAIGILSNTVLKIGIILVVGRNRFRFYATLGLLALAAGSIAGLVLYWK
jgi:uncharacterized membrane protein (DUF4010 family)